MPGAAPNRRGASATAHPAVLALHESGTSGAIWRALGEALDSHAELIAPDRPGWGDEEAPEGYARTTITEQAGFARRFLLDGATPTVICGAGIGAVTALELALAEPERVSSIVLIEPPLLSFVPAATDRLAADVALLRETVAKSGRGAVLRGYVAGRYAALGPGAGRIPPHLAASGEPAATALFAELPAVPGWERTDADLAALRAPAVVVLAADSSPFLRTAAEELARTLGRGELRETEAGLPHVDCAGELAALIIEVAEAVA